jgi:WD40 repeat protein/class 3 adenylate cyclase
MTLAAPDAGAVPTGTVTFLFTDIEGSTRLLQRLGARYAELLAGQRDLLRAEFTEWHGHEIDTQGDAFFVAFATAADAVRCAVAAQRALDAAEWPDGVALRVRMGLHTGEPLVGATGYVGLSVHRAARIAAAGHGGQILLSGTTRDLVEDDLPAGTALRDLGSHRLKDLRDETRIFDLVVDGLAADFPALATASAPEPPPTPGEPPYRGLQAFEEQDAGLFFGRTEIVAALADQVREARFVALVGASGSGKSSILRAGLLPVLRAAGWRILLLTPTAHPLEALADALAPDVSPAELARLVDDLRTEPRSLALALRSKLHLRRAGAHRTLIAVDQLEELFTLCRDETERDTFLANLAGAAGLSEASADTPPGPDRASVIVTLRADFYAHLASYPVPRDAAAASQRYVGAMSPTELEQAISQPAEMGGWEFAPGLVELLLGEVGSEPGALPLLSHALLETWRRRRGVTMTLRSYTESGGVRGAIARTADRVYEAELSEPARAIARGIFVRLTELGEGTADTRRRARLDELVPMGSDEQAAAVRAVLERLAEARLVTITEDSVEVAHEALIREWPTLREWLTADREGLRLHRRLTEAAAEWHAAGEDEALVFRGTRLAQLRDWAQANPGAPNELERRFLDASIELAEREEREREATRRREIETANALARGLRQRAVLLAGGLLAAVLLAGLAALFAQQSNDNAALAQRHAAEAIANAARADSQRLGAEADSLVSSDAGLAALLALNALGTTYTPQADAALQIAGRWLTGPVFAHDGPVWGLAITPDGQTLITGAGDTIYFWNATSGQPNGAPIETSMGPPEPRSPDNLSRQLSLSADGTTLLVQDQGGQAAIYRVSDRALVGSDSQSGVRAISPDGGEVASGGCCAGFSFRTLQVVDTSTSLLVSKLPQILVDRYLTFSPDGRRLGGVENSGKNVFVVDTKPDSRPTRMGTTIGLFDHVQFSADGKYLVAASGDGNAYIFDAQAQADGQPPLAAFTGAHTGALFDAQLSANGQLLVTSSSDGTACLWDVPQLSAGTPAQSVTRRQCYAHGGVVEDAVLSPDGRYVFTASADGTVRRWPTASLNEGATWHMDVRVAGLDFSADGSRLAVMTANRLQVLDLAGGQPRQIMGVPDPFGAAARPNFITRLALSPDGRLVLAASGPEAALWNVTTQSSITGYFNEVQNASLYPSAASFSADGTRLLAPVGRGLAVLDAANGKPVLALNFEGDPWTATLSPDGRRVAVWVQGSYHIWDVATEAPAGYLTGQSRDNSKPIDLAFTPEGSHLVSGDQDNVVRLWEIASPGSLVREFSGHTDAIQTVRVSSDGHYLLTASLDGTARLWDLASGALVREFPGHAGSQVTAAAISRDGRTVAIGSADGTVILTPVDLSAQEQQVCTALGGRTLSDQERAEYGVPQDGPACP